MVKRWMPSNRALTLKSLMGLEHQMKSLLTWKLEMAHIKARPSSLPDCYRNTSTSDLVWSFCLKIYPCFLQPKSLPYWE